MLKEVLSPEDCAKCGFCCSFRRQSLHLTPLFAKETVEEICRLYPDAHFRTLPNGAVTIDIGDQYKTDDSEEEALCPFNRKGCILPQHLKPFDCELWPFRLMKSGNGLALALVPTCPWLDKDSSKFKETAAEVAEKAVAYAKTHPELVIEYRPDYQLVVLLPEEK
jgi:hypothetical protein